MNAACRGAFSTHTANVAPRLRHSRLSAPLPPKSSSTRAPATRAPRLLKTACLTRSGVGRTAMPFGTFKIRPPDCPPVMRMEVNHESTRMNTNQHESKHTWPFIRVDSCPFVVSFEMLREELFHRCQLINRLPLK